MKSGLDDKPLFLQQRLLKIARIQSITLFLSLIQKGEHKLTEVLMLGECFEE